MRSCVPETPLGSPPESPAGLRYGEFTFLSTCSSIELLLVLDVDASASPWSSPVAGAESAAASRCRRVGYIRYACVSCVPAPRALASPVPGADRLTITPHGLSRFDIIRSTNSRLPKLSSLVAACVTLLASPQSRRYTLGLGGGTRRGGRLAEYCSSNLLPLCAEGTSPGVHTHTPCRSR